MTPTERQAWLQHLLDIATSAAEHLRIRNDPSNAALLTDLDALCGRLSRELGTLE